MTAARTAFVAALQEALLPLSDGERAAGMAAYMQGRFPFLGVQTPERRKASRLLIRSVTENPVHLAIRLWTLPEREYQYVACDLLRHHAPSLQPEDLPALESLLTEKSWWDTVDGLAVSIGTLVLRHPAQVSRMDRLIASENFWLRRTALLHQLSWKGATDEKRLYDYCLSCADDREFFIRKAIGWALRQYARSNPESVATFLRQHGEKLSALSRKEAGKHLHDRFF